MKTQKFWWGKSTKQKVFTREFGWCEVVKFYLFGLRGLHIWTEHHSATTMVPETKEELIKMEEVAARIEISKTSRLSDQIATMLEYNLYHNNPQH